MVDDTESGPKPLNKRQKSKIQTRQGVIDAGRELFVMGGYQAATVRDIAQRIRREDKPIGMSTGAVFANFEDKADLLFTIVKEEIGPHGSLLELAATKEGAVLDRIVSVCTTDFEFFSERLHLFEALAVLETDSSDEKNQRARSLTGHRREALWRIIETILRESGWNARHSQTIAECVLSIHLDRCRYQAIMSCNTKSYRLALKEQLSYILRASTLGLGV